LDIDQKYREEMRGIMLCMLTLLLQMSGVVHQYSGKFSFTGVAPNQVVTMVGAFYHTDLICPAEMFSDAHEAKTFTFVSPSYASKRKKLFHMRAHAYAPFMNMHMHMHMQIHCEGISRFVRRQLHEWLALWKYCNVTTSIGALLLCHVRRGIPKATALRPDTRVGEAYATLPASHPGIRTW
jgi:hypothetical protein